jgi:hypothetical protein
MSTKIDVFTNSMNPLTLLEGRSYGDNKHMDFYLMEGTRHLYITGEVSAFQASRLLNKGLSEKQITVIKQVQAFKLDNSSYFYPRIKSVKKAKRFTTLLLMNMNG